MSWQCLADRCGVQTAGKLKSYRGVPVVVCDSCGYTKEATISIWRAVLTALQTGRSRIAKGHAQRGLERARGYMVLSGNTSVSADGPLANRWCALGALHGVTPIVYDLAQGELRRVIAQGLVSTYNDTHTQEEVVALFERAIEGVERTIKDLSS